MRGSQPISYSATKTYKYAKPYVDTPQDINNPQSIQEVAELIIGLKELKITISRTVEIQVMGGLGK